MKWESIMQRSREESRNVKIRKMKGKKMLVYSEHKQQLCMCAGGFLGTAGGYTSLNPPPLLHYTCPLHRVRRGELGWGSCIQALDVAGVGEGFGGGRVGSGRGCWL